MPRKLSKKLKREVILFVGSLILIGFGGVALWAASIKIPDIKSLGERKVVQSTTIYDRTGTILLDDLGDDVTRTIVPLSEISPFIQRATIAVEDATFYEHEGVRPLATFRALFLQPLRGKGVQGGSTITQQVVKNSILTTDRTITRKLKEWVLAVRLEQSLTKESILELYLNENPYGGAMYGVEEASQTFFGKPANDVSLAEAAYLASLPQAPTYYSPYGNNREALDGRKNYVLDRMLELGLATEADITDAKNEEVVFLPPAATGIRAPHFVFYVREQLEKEFGQEALLENGWRVITTLDAELQAKAEEIVKRKAFENEVKYKASNAALVAMVPQTGDIVAMVGSRDYFDTDIDGAVNVALAPRQPGSSFKPFVYAAAFEEGYAPETVTFDMPTQFSTLCPVDSTETEAPCYYPGNYDEKFRGPMSFRDALAQSINIVAVKALYLVGIQDALRVARAMGITTLNDPDRYGLTLVLGGGVVRLLEMVGAYGVFANEGVKNPPRGILKIEDRSGEVVQEYPLAPEEVLPQSIALSISDVLSDNEARAPEFGLNSALQIPGRHIAAKTGTTNDFRDTWILGYSPTLVVGAWAGNNDNTPMEKKIAGFIVAPIWNEFFVEALKTYPDTPFPEPQKLVTEASRPIIRGIWQGFDPVRVDAFTGVPVPENYGGLTKYRVTSNVHDILHSVSRGDPLGPFPENPAEDPQYLRWEYGARAWALRNGYVDGQSIFVPAP